jgi:hypothetical protein
VGGVVSLVSSPSISRSFFLFSFLSLIFFSHSQSRSPTTHSQSQNIQPLIEIIYLTIKYNSYTSHKLQDSQYILDHKIHNSFTSHKNPSHNLSKFTINLVNVSRTLKNRQRTHTRASYLPAPPGLAAPAPVRRLCRPGTTPRAPILQIERDVRSRAMR